MTGLRSAVVAGAMGLCWGAAITSTAVAQTTIGASELIASTPSTVIMGRTSIRFFEEGNNINVLVRLDASGGVREQFRYATTGDGRLPRLAIQIGNETRYADYVTSHIPWTSATSHCMETSAPAAGVRSNNLCFRYTVQAGDRDPDGFSIGRNPVELRDTTILIGDGEDITVTLADPLLQEEDAIFNDPRRRVEGGADATPRIVAVSVAPPAYGDTFYTGENIWVAVDYSVPVRPGGSGTPELTLDVGGTDRVATLDAERTRRGLTIGATGDLHAGTHRLWFAYRVAAGDADTDGIGIPPDGLSTPSSAIRLASDRSVIVPESLAGIVVSRYLGRKVASHADAAGASNVNHAGALHAENDGGDVPYRRPTLTGSPVWSIDGADARWFSINGSTGALRFRTAPDHERPNDSDADNTYLLRVTASDTGGRVTRVVRLVVGVSDVDEPGEAHVTQSRPVAGANLAGQVIVIDPDGAWNASATWERQIVGQAWESVDFEADTVEAGYRYRVTMAYRDAFGDKTAVSDPTEAAVPVAGVAERLAVSLAQGGVRVAEGGVATVPLSVSPASSAALTVDLGISGDVPGEGDVAILGDTGRALGGDDVSRGQVVIPPWRASGTFAVRATDDSWPEPAETETVVIKGVTSADPTAVVDWDPQGSVVVTVAESDPVHVELDGLRKMWANTPAVYTLDLLGVGGGRMVEQASPVAVTATVRVFRAFMEVPHGSFRGRLGASSDFADMEVTVPAGVYRHKFTVPTATRGEDGWLGRLHLRLVDVSAEGPVIPSPQFSRVYTDVVHDLSTTDRVPEVASPLADMTLTIGEAQPQDDPYVIPEESRLVDLRPVFADPVERGLTYEARSSDPSVATAVPRARYPWVSAGATLIAGRFLILTPLTPGTTTVTVWARAEDGLSTRTSFAVTVLEPPPILRELDLAVGQPLSVAASALVTLPGVADTSHSAVSSDPSVAQAIVTGDGILVLDPRAVGQATVTVTAFGTGPSRAVNVPVRVHAAATAAFAWEMPDVTLDVGEAVGFTTVVDAGVTTTVDAPRSVALPPLTGERTLVGSDGETVTLRPDLSGLRLTVSPLPAGMGFDPALLELTGAPTAAGETTVTHTAVGGGQTVTQVFTVTVLADTANRAPEPATVGRRMTVAVNSLPVRTLWDGLFHDPDGDDLHYAVSVDDPGRLEVTGADWGFSMLPHERGWARVTLVALDSGGLSATSTLSVWVGRPRGPRMTLSAHALENLRNRDGERVRWGQGRTQVYVGTWLSDDPRDGDDFRTPKFPDGLPRLAGVQSLTISLGVSPDSTEGFLVAGKNEGMVVAFGPAGEEPLVGPGAFMLDLTSGLTTTGSIVFDGWARGYQIEPTTLTVHPANTRGNGGAAWSPPTLSVVGTGDDSVTLGWRITPNSEYVRLVGWRVVRTEVPDGCRAVDEEGTAAACAGESLATDTLDPEARQIALGGLERGTTHSFRVAALLQDIRGELGHDPTRRGSIYAVWSEPLEAAALRVPGGAVTVSLADASNALSVEEGSAARLSLTFGGMHTPLTDFTATIGIAADSDGATTDADPMSDVGGTSMTQVVRVPPSGLPEGVAAGQYIWVRIPDDQLSEGSERFVVSLTGVSSASGSAIEAASGSDASRAVDIAASDGATVVLEGPRNVRVGRVAAYVVRLSPEGITLAEDLTVQYSTADGTATDGTDYTAQSGTLTFTPDDAGPRVVRVATADDGADDDPDKSFTFGLSMPGGGGGPDPIVTSAPVTTALMDDDLAATLTAGFASAAGLYATEGAADATVTVTLSDKPGRDVRIPVASTQASGGNPAGTVLPEWRVEPQYALFDPGATVATVTVRALPDRMDEPGAEVVTLSLGPTEGVETGATAFVTLVDADPAPTVRLLPDTTLVNEDDGEPIRVSVAVVPSGFDRDLTLSLSFPGSGAGTATRGTDYSVSGDSTLTVAAGAQTSPMTLTLTPMRDSVDESGTALPVTWTSTLGLTPDTFTVVTVSLSGETVTVSATALGADGRPDSRVSVPALTVHIAEFQPRPLLPQSVDVVTNSLVITGQASIDFAENGTATVQDFDGGTGGEVVWGLRGPDAGLFRIDQQGRVRFETPPDHESPRDLDGDNVHEFEVVATDPETLEHYGGFIHSDSRWPADDLPPGEGAHFVEPVNPGGQGGWIARWINPPVPGIGSVGDPFRLSLHHDSMSVTVTVTDADEPGTVTVSDTLEAVTATLADVDTPLTNVRWSWEREMSGGATAPISGATDGVYILTAMDAGATLHAVARYDDRTGAGKTARGSTDGAVSVAPSFDHVRPYSEDLADDPAVADLIGFVACDRSGQNCRDTALIFPRDGSRVAVTLQLPEAFGGVADLTYSVTGLPSGLDFDAATRVITGTFMTTVPGGGIEFTLTASDGDPSTSDATLNLRVGSGQHRNVPGRADLSRTYAAPRFELVPAVSEFRSGQTITLLVTFPGEWLIGTDGDQEVTASLQIGDNERVLTTTAIESNDVSTDPITLTYAVQASDFDEDGIELTGVEFGPSFRVALGAAALPAGITPTVTLFWDGTSFRPGFSGRFPHRVDGMARNQNIDIVGGSRLRLTLGTPKGVEISRYFRDPNGEPVSPFYDPNGESLSVGATSSDTGVFEVRVDNARSVYVFNPVAAGVATVTLEASDGIDSRDKQVTVTVVDPAAAAAAVGTIEDLTLAVGPRHATLVGIVDKFSGSRLAHTATEDGSGVVAVAIESVGTGESVEPQLRVTPLAVGTGMVTVTATDANGSTATQEFGVEVTANSAPAEAATIDDTFVVLGRSWRVDVAPGFDDAEGDPLYYSAESSAPGIVGARMEGATLVLRGLAAGSVTVTVTAADAEGREVSQEIGVDVNRIPVAAQPGGTTITMYRYNNGTPGDTADDVYHPVTVNVATLVSDPDGDMISYPTSLGGNDYDSSWLGVEIDGALLTVTRTAATPGSETVRVRVRDSRRGAVDVLLLAESAYDRGPQLSNALLPVTLPSNGTREIDVGAQFFHPAGLSVTLGNVSSGDAAFATAEITGGMVTVSAVAEGETTIMVEAWDANQTNTVSFAVTVGADPAGAAPAAAGSIPAVDVAEGEIPDPIDVADRFTDSDSPTLVYTASIDDPSVARIVIDGSMVLVRPLSAGATTVTVTATDGDGQTVVQEFDVEVGPRAANTAPTAAGAIQAVTLTSDGGVRMVNVAGNFNDPEGGALDLSVTSGDPSVVRAVVNGDVVTVSPVDVGSTRVTVVATDPGGLSASQTFGVTVREPAPPVSDEMPGEPPVEPTNEAPMTSGAIQAVTLTVGERETRDVSRNFSDPEGGALDISVTSGDPLVARAVESGGTVTVTAIGPGSTTVTVTAEDPGGLSASLSFAVEVEAVPGAPMTVGRPNIRSFRDNNNDTPEEIDLSAYFTDPDGGGLIFDATSSKPSVADVAVNGNTLTVTPGDIDHPTAQMEVATVTVTATETGPEGQFAVLLFEVTVTNPRPTAEGTIPEVEWPLDDLEEGAVPKPVVRDVSGNFSDPDNDALRYQVSVNPMDIVTAVLPPGGTMLTVSPIVDDDGMIVEGTAHVTVTAMDADGGVSPPLVFRVRVGKVSVPEEFEATVFPEFGRALIESVAEAVGLRLEGGIADSDASFRVAGQSLQGGEIDWEARAARQEGSAARAVPLSELWDGASFSLPAAHSGGAHGWSIWGKGDYRALEGGSSGFTWDGESYSGYLGIDRNVGPRARLGVALGHTEGEFDYDDADGDSSDLSTSMTSVTPYFRWTLDADTSVWGLLGYGKGEVEFTENTLDSELMLVALGARKDFKFNDELDLGIRFETQAAQIETDADVAADIPGYSADVQSHRLVGEMSSDIPVDNGGTLTPRFEIGARIDTGDGDETGNGVEVGGSLTYRNASFTAALRGRHLVTHSSSRKEETGVSLLAKLTPGGGGHGWSFSVSPSYGSLGRAIDEIWGTRPLEADDRPDRARLDAETAHGFGVLGGRALLTPFLRVGLGDDSGTLRVGSRLGLRNRLQLSIEGTTEFADDGTRRRIDLRGSLPF